MAMRVIYLTGFEFGRRKDMAGANQPLTVNLKKDSFTLMIQTINHRVIRAIIRIQCNVALLEVDKCTHAWVAALINGFFY